jgi:hypothetical protein
MFTVSKNVIFISIFQVQTTAGKRHGKKDKAKENEENQGNAENSEQHDALENSGKYSKNIVCCWTTFVEDIMFFKNITYVLTISLYYFRNLIWH